MPISDETKKAIFAKLKTALLACCPPMKVAKSSDSGMEIMGNKPVPYGYKKEIVPGMYFASIVMRKDSVNFYFFPIYMDAKAYEKLAPILLKCLKGKTCFHFKKEDDINETELQAMLKTGVDAWKKQGYMV